MNPNPSYYRGVGRPVESVSWYDAVEFCEALSSILGYGVRLPTDEEWVAAAGEPPPEEDLRRYAHFGADETASVGDVEAWQGFLGMRGNVWEWTATDEGSGRVLRGGAWYDTARSVRAAARTADDPGVRYDFLGFRLARGPAQRQERAGQESEGRANEEGSGLPLPNWVAVPGHPRVQLADVPVTQGLWSAVADHLDLDDTAEYPAPEPFDPDARMPAALDYKLDRERHIADGTISCGNLSLNELRELIGFAGEATVLEAETVTLEQELWVRGWCTEQRGRQRAATPGEAGDLLLEDFRRRFPGALDDALVEERRLRDMTCPQCKKEFRLLHRETLITRACPSGGIYDVLIRCEHCDYEEAL